MLRLHVQKTGLQLEQVCLCYTFQKTCLQLDQVFHGYRLKNFSTAIAEISRLHILKTGLLTYKLCTYIRNVIHLKAELVNLFIKVHFQLTTF